MDIYFLSTAYNQYKCRLRKKDTKDVTIKGALTLSYKC